MSTPNLPADQTPAPKEIVDELLADTGGIMFCIVKQEWDEAYKALGELRDKVHDVGMKAVD